MAVRIPSARTAPAKSAPAAGVAGGRPSSRFDSTAAPWTFLSNHAHVLICIADDPEARMRDLADRVGVTERAVQRIVAELEEAGYLIRHKEGRRNRYQVTASRPLRHSIEKHCGTDELLGLVLGKRGKTIE